jgi:hypothetical protein
LLVKYVFATTYVFASQVTNLKTKSLVRKSWKSQRKITGKCQAKIEFPSSLLEGELHNNYQSNSGGETVEK